MSESSTPARLPPLPRHKLTALGLVGAVVVALPLVQVLRYQNAELRAVLNERAGLDPVARAVAVQHGLLAHRDIAAQVLRGRLSLEPQRKLRQVEVGDRLASLSLALASGSWERAMREAEALNDDWAALSREVLARHLNAAESDQAHRLLVEQTLQVIDLVSVASAPPLGGAGVGDLPSVTVAHALPQLAWRIASLAQGGHEANRPSADLDVAEAELARTLGRLNAAIEGRPPRQESLAEASASAGATADRLFRLLRSGPTAAEETRAASAAALQAQFHLFELAQAARATTLDGRASAIGHERTALLTALAALLGVAVVLMLRIARDLRPQRAAPASDAAAAAPPPRRHDEAGRLLRRLREGRDAPTSRGHHTEPQPTLPPED